MNAPELLSFVYVYWLVEIWFTAAVNKPTGLLER